MLVSASLLYQLLIQGRYLALRGTVLNAEQTMIRKHTKVIILEAEGKALRIQLRNRHMKVAQGDIVRVCCRLVAGRQTFRMAIGGWIQDLLLFEPFSNLRGSFAGRAQGEYLLYDGCGFFIDDPFLFVLRAFHIPIGRNGRQMLAGLAFALPCSANLFGGIAGIHFVEHIADRGKLTLLCKLTHIQCFVFSMLCH